MSPQDNRFNTPAEMLARLVFASRYLFFLAGLIFAIIAAIDLSLLAAAKSVVFFAAMTTGQIWLKRTGKLDECDRAFESMFNAPQPDEDEELYVLLRRRETLEEKRGQPGFDPWEVQAVRREISAYCKLHPEAEALVDSRY